MTASRPAWAGSSNLHADLDDTAQVRHVWEAPQRLTMVFGYDERLPLQVELCRDDVVTLVDGEVATQAGQPFVFLHPADARLVSVEDVRALAAALQACADRWAAGQ